MFVIPSGRWRAAAGLAYLEPRIAETTDGGPGDWDAVADQAIKQAEKDQAAREKAATST